MPTLLWVRATLAGLTVLMAETNAYMRRDFDAAATRCMKMGCLVLPADRGLCGLEDTLDERAGAGMSDRPGLGRAAGRLRAR